MSLVDHMRRAVVWVASISLWYKLIIGTILGAIGGSTVVAFLNTYAIYSYSYWYGARIPVEGVPYLGLAVSIVSFAFLITSLTCAIVVYGLLALATSLLRRLFSWMINAYRRRRADPRPLPETLKTLISMLAAAISSVSGLLSLLGYDDWLRVKLPTQTLIIGSVVLVCVVTVLSVRPWLVKWFALLLTIGLIVVIVIVMFNPGSYGRFLREIKYGGGTSIKVTYKNPDDELKEYEGYLFLVTSEAYVLYDDNSMSYVEIPADNVSRIQYDVHASHVLPGEVPRPR
jgi:hypothetical protein